MSFSIVRFEDVAPQPWKNGGGVTREMLTWPSVDDWLMRVSVADIDRDGPFSAFIGVDRWFAVLAGNGVRLGTPPKTLRCSDDALHFNGDDAPDCTLIDGPTRDLNLMLRRDAASGWMQRVAVGFEGGTGASLSGVFAVDGCAMGGRDGADVWVPSMSIAWCVDAPWRVVDCDAGARLFAFQCVERS